MFSSGEHYAVEFPLGFPVQYLDKETNLHYNYFRDYDPQTGRYVQSDPIGLAGGLNTYGYVGQNPLAAADPTGQFTIAELAVAAGIVYFGGVVAGVFPPPSILIGKPKKADDPLGAGASAGPSSRARQSFGTNQIGRLLREKCPPGDDAARDRRREAEEECYEECKHLLGSKDLQASEYSRYFRRCMFDKGFPGLPPD